MQAVQAQESVNALNNFKLSTRVKLKDSNKKLSVIAVADASQCSDRSKAYIIMNAPFSSGHELIAQHKGKTIGFAELSYNASYLDRIDNYEPDSYSHVGSALVEVTARLALLSGFKSVGLYAVDSSTAFHFKMGARFNDADTDEAVKDIITQDLDDDPRIFGEMRLDIAQKSSGKDSPRLMSKILKDEISQLSL